MVGQVSTMMVAIIVIFASFVWVLDKWLTFLTNKFQSEIIQILLVIVPFVLLVALVAGAVTGALS